MGKVFLPSRGQRLGMGALLLCLCPVLLLLLIILSPLIMGYVLHRLYIKRRPIQGLWSKISGTGPRVAHGQVLIHGVSLGEVMLMRPLVPPLEKALHAHCVVTTSTTAGREALDKHFSDHDRAWWPFDAPWAVELFLERTQPRLIILLELEVWPIMLMACQRRGIPVMVLNGRITPRSVTGYKRWEFLLRPLFASLRLVVAQNAEWAAGFCSIGVPVAQVRTLGSMKADIVRPADDAAMQAESARINILPSAPILLLASTGPGEEEACIASWKQWGATANPPWRLIICPRHPERGHEVADLCRRMALAPQRSSQGEQAEDNPRSIIIIDEIGRLAALYALCATSHGIAVVGGGLGSGRGGQNMLEAAAAGCCTVVGWDLRNQPDAMAALRAANAVVEVTEIDLHPRLMSLSTHTEQRTSMGQRGREAWTASRGATERTVDAVRSVLEDVSQQ